MDYGILEIEKFDDLRGDGYLLICRERKYRVSRLLAEVATRLKNGETVPGIAAALGKDPKAIEALRTDYVDRVLTAARKRSSFLYLKLNLVGKKTIARLSQALAFLFTRNAAFFLVPIGVLASAFLMLWGFGTRAISFDLRDLVSSLSWPVALILYLSLFLKSIFHELGHAAAMRHFGRTVGEIGVGVYLTAVVFYSNVDEAWRLSRGKRILVDLGGVYFQLLLSIPLAVACPLIQEGTLRTVLLYFAFMNLAGALGNLFPFLRFDGYWIAADAFGIPHLQDMVLAPVRDLLSRRKPGRRPSVLGSLSQNQRTLVTGYLVASAMVFLIFVGIVVIFCLSYFQTLPREVVKIVKLQASPLEVFQFILTTIVVIGLAKTIGESLFRRTTRTIQDV